MQVKRAMMAALVLPGVATIFGAGASLAGARDGEPLLAPTPAAASRSLFQADVPPVRFLEIESVSGAEPDPESFDRAGLERWWDRYRASADLPSTRPMSRVLTHREE